MVDLPAHAAGTPTFAQQVTGHGWTMPKLDVALGSNVTVGNRIVVETGIWSPSHATVAAASGSAGNSYVEVPRFVASDRTEMSVWSAVVSRGGGMKPTISVTPSSPDDVAAIVFEYAGLSTVFMPGRSTCCQMPAARPGRRARSPPGRPPP